MPCLVGDKGTVARDFSAPPGTIKHFLKTGSCKRNNEVRNLKKNMNQVNLYNNL